MENYTCLKCGNTLLKSNKFLHDLKCTSSSLEKNDNNSNYLLKYSNDEPSDNYNNYYICEICNARLKTKDKADHLICHQLENESNRDNNIFNYNDSINRENQNNFFLNSDIRINNRNLNRNLNIRLNAHNSDDDDYDEDEEGSNVINDDSIESFDDLGNDGLDEDIIETIPISKIKSITNLSEEKKKCLICLEDYKIGDDSIILPCIHIFHAECIKKWMKKQNICPICKNKINSNNNANY